MKDNRTNATIAILFLAAAVIMLVSLSYAIGKWSFASKRYELTINFPNATGITANSAVKYAGAVVGKVKEVRLIPRDQQTQDPNTTLYNCIAVVVEVDDSLKMGVDTSVIIKQDGLGIAAKYLLFTPGVDRTAKLIAPGDTMQGTMPFDLADLIQPAGEALQQAKILVDQLRPIMNRFDKLSETMSSELPPLIKNGNTFLKSGNTFLTTSNSFVGNLNTPENRDRLNDMIANLRVSTENLKVVSSNTKALTATLAEKPWRVFWGGQTIPAPSEAAVLKSNKVIPLNADVDVTPALPPAKK